MQFNTSGFFHQSEITLNGRTYRSSYNHNYYYNQLQNRLVLEEYVMDEWVQYWEVDLITGEQESLGSTVDNESMFNTDEFGVYTLGEFT